MSTISSIDTLRKAHSVLESLPPALAADTSDDTANPIRPIKYATIDDVAFAIVRAERAFSAAGDRLVALRKLYDLARENGGVGSDRAVDAAVKSKAGR